MLYKNFCWSNWPTVRSLEDNLLAVLLVSRNEGLSCDIIWGVKILVGKKRAALIRGKHFQQIPEMSQRFLDPKGTARESLPQTVI